MKRMLLVILMLISASLLAACGRSAITPRAHTATPIPELNVTRPPETARPARPTTDPSPETITQVSPTATVTLTPSPTPTSSPTLTPSPAVTRVTPTPTSSGPLTVAVYVASCRRAPTAGKPGNVVVQISIEATGGNGQYHYFNQGEESPTKFIDITWERGTRLIGKVMVTSDDGQHVEKEYDIPTGELDCK
jgi:hypothetical protein